MNNTLILVFKAIGEEFTHEAIRNVNSTYYVFLNREYITVTHQNLNGRSTNVKSK